MTFRIYSRFNSSSPLGRAGGVGEEIRGGELISNDDEFVDGGRASMLLRCRDEKLLQ